jgi:tRNA acetyltransferase TAN1
LYPKEEEGAESGAENDEDDEELDLEASIAKEVAALKNTKVKKRYANITTGTDCGMYRQ